MDIIDYINLSIYTKQKIIEDKTITENIKKIASEIISSYKKNNKILLAGNGGSAADAQHIASELVSKLSINRLGLSAISLTTNTSVITSISNDYGYEQVFSKQIEACGNKDDIFIGISTSGSSLNILEAFKVSKKIGLITVGLTGENSFQDESNIDYLVKVPSDNTPIIQEAHIMIGHILCTLVENALFRDSK